MSELVEFLLARIAEDEAVANEAKAKGPKRVADGWSADLYPGWDRYEVVEDDGRDLWTHVTVGWDRVLAECAAKRAIIEEHQTVAEALGWGWAGWRCYVCKGFSEPKRKAYPCPTVRAIAPIYADHPDFREEWLL